MVHNCGSSFSLWNHLMLMTVNFIIYYIYWALQGQGTMHISCVFWSIDKMNSIVIIRSLLANLNKLVLRNWSIKYIVFLSISVFTWCSKNKNSVSFFYMSSWQHFVSNRHSINRVYYKVNCYQKLTT